MHYVECGVIRAPDVRDVGARLFAIACDLAEVIDEFEPQAFAIERAFHGKSAASALKLGQARGALMLLAHQRGLPTFEYAPAQVKRAVVGHGAATKQAIADRMKLLFTLRRAPAADAADALAIAACHALSRL
jgi:crossover junction endodeoxyribonuclease RuvC